MLGAPAPVAQHGGPCHGPHGTNSQPAISSPFARTPPRGPHRPVPRRAGLQSFKSRCFLLYAGAVARALRVESRRGRTHARPRAIATVATSSASTPIPPPLSSLLILHLSGELPPPPFDWWRSARGGRHSRVDQRCSPPPPPPRPAAGCQLTPALGGSGGGGRGGGVPWPFLPPTSVPRSGVL